MIVMKNHSRARKKEQHNPELESSQCCPYSCCSGTGRRRFPMSIHSPHTHMKPCPETTHQSPQQDRPVIPMCTGQQKSSFGSSKLPREYHQGQMESTHLPAAPYPVLPAHSSLGFPGPASSQDMAGGQQAPAVTRAQGSLSRRDDSSDK